MSSFLSGNERQKNIVFQVHFVQTFQPILPINFRPEMAGAASDEKNGATTYGITTLSLKAISIIGIRYK
jgi:hypothetical protein